jgi:probable metal-binding protein
MSDVTGTNVHAHEVLRLIAGADSTWTVDGLRREVEGRFGVGCRFETCSASDMDFDQLLQFLLQRRKIALLDGVVTADPSKICDHD